MKIKKTIKLVVITILTISFFVGLFFIIKYTGIIKILNNLQEIKILIKSAGFWSYSVFAVLQFLQVSVLPLPASVTTIAGIILFGPMVAFMISTLSIILGSICAYACGKFFKDKLVKKFVKENKLNEIQKMFEKGNFVFFIMMLFPFFPDDILCLIAGFTNMDFKFFLLTNLITRPIGLFCLCFLGSGKIIPLSFWGLVVFVLIGIIFVILSFLVFKKIGSKKT